MIDVWCVRAPKQTASSCTSSSERVVGAARVQLLQRIEPIPKRGDRWTRRAESPWRGRSGRSPVTHWFARNVLTMLRL